VRELGHELAGVPGAIAAISGRVAAVLRRVTQAAPHLLLQRTQAGVEAVAAEEVEAGLGESETP
jgi:hypothetical protein